MAGKMSKVKTAKRQRALLHKRKIRRRIVLLIIELLLLVVLGAAAYAMSKFDKLDTHTLNKSKLEIYQDTGDFTNVALFGLDSRDGELGEGVRSDSMMIASINNKTKAVKVVSIYRDTLTQQEDGTYEKANYAYADGGPQEAIALLNRNFDLDIQKYISVNFNSLADIIDALGGIEIDLTPEEVFWTNGYCTETSKVVGRKTKELTKPGKQVLDGIQAVSYARIRKTAGDDFKRTERQRTVLTKVVEKAKKASLPTLNKIIDKILPQVSTNLSASDFLGMAADSSRYKLNKMAGFPFDVTPVNNVIGLEGSYVTAIGFADNVKQLHKYLFGVDNYKVSAKVEEIDKDVAYLTGINGDDYPKKEGNTDYDGSSGGSGSTGGDSSGGSGSTGGDSSGGSGNTGGDSSGDSGSAGADSSGTSGSGTGDSSSYGGGSTQDNSAGSYGSQDQSGTGISDQSGSAYSQDGANN